MNPIALIAQVIPLTEQSMFVIWILIALMVILDIAVIIFLFRVGLKRNGILTDYEAAQIYDLTKRALIKAIEEYENGKAKRDDEERVKKLATTLPKVENTVLDKESKIRVPYRKRTA